MSNQLLHGMWGSLKSVALVASGYWQEVIFLPLSKKSQLKILSYTAAQRDAHRHSPLF
jgi:hypothetical protein